MNDLNKMYIDVVYCVDLTYVTTQSLNKIKNSILALRTELSNGYNYYPSLTLKMRIKVIGYSNGCNETDPIFEKSDFFVIPEEENRLKNFLNSLKIQGSKGGTNHSLEALASAMQSDWCSPTLDYTIRRKWHCIVLFTGASARPLEETASSTNSNYHRNIPTSYFELVDWWCDTGITHGMNQRAKRLAVIAPENSEPWTDLADEFDNCWTIFTDPNKDVDNLLSYLHSNFIRVFDENICF